MKHNNTEHVEMTDEQRAAVAKFTADVKRARPYMAQAAAVARQIHQEFVTAPGWHIAEAPRPAGCPEPGTQEWSVGHAKVNYVDHIKTAQDDQ